MLHAIFQNVSLAKTIMLQHVKVRANFFNKLCFGYVLI